MQQIDPYRQWLGIPPEEQPPNHYRLLGVGLFEPDPAVIATAADRQMAHVRAYQYGEHVDLSQRLLNELAAARVCLLDVGRKSVYDEWLRSRLNRTSTGGTPPPPRVGEPPVAPPPPVPDGSAPGDSHASRGASGSWWNKPRELRPGPPPPPPGTSAPGPFVPPAPIPEASRPATRPPGSVAPHAMPYRPDAPSAIGSTGVRGMRPGPAGPPPPSQRPPKAADDADKPVVISTGRNTYHFFRRRRKGGWVGFIFVMIGIAAAVALLVLLLMLASAAG